MINSQGGTIIYGIKENHGKAEKLDIENAYNKSNNNLRPERIIQYIRTSINPPPNINVCQIPLHKVDNDSPWFLGVEIEQGLQAYMARDKHFYKRVGLINQIMEQYEVVDVMNRTKAAVLDSIIEIKNSYPEDLNLAIYLSINITSTNYIASEYGAMRMTVAMPMEYHNAIVRDTFGQIENCGLLLDGYDDEPHAHSIFVRWGANTGNVIFPGTWYNFHNNSVRTNIPLKTIIPGSIYLIKIELFTMNSLGRSKLFSLIANSPQELFIEEVNPENREKIISRFWNTYHSFYK
jgi:predicted HTH transcriptional regulator